MAIGEQSESEDEESTKTTKLFLDHDYFLVESSCLLELLAYCPQCGDACELSAYKRGSVITVK